MRSTETPVALPFFSMANKILTAADNKAVDQTILDVAKMKLEYGEAISPADADKLATLRLLCDIRQLWLGNTLKEKDREAHPKLREKFLDVRALASRGETLELFDQDLAKNYDSRMAAITSALLFETDLLAKANTVINLAFNLLVLTVSMREQMGEDSEILTTDRYDVILTDKVPQDEYDHYLYYLLKAAYRKLFELRALLMEQRRDLQDSGTNSSSCDNNIALLDAILVNLNLHENLACRVKFSFHQAAVIDNNSEVRRHYFSGVNFDLRAVQDYKDLISIIHSRYTDIIQIYAVYILLNGKDLLRETELSLLLKKLIRQLDFDLQVAAVYSIRHKELVDEVRDLEMITSFMHVIRWKLKITDTLVMSPTYDAIHLAYCSQSIFKPLLHARPEILLLSSQGDTMSRLKVFSDMRHNLQAFVKAYSTITLGKSAYAEIVMEYWLACMFSANDKVELAMIAELSIADNPIFNDVHPNNKGMYKLLWMVTLAPNLVVTDCVGFLELSKTKLLSLDDMESFTNAVLLRRFFDHVSSFILTIHKSGTEDQKKEASYFENVMKAYMNTEFASLALWADELSRVNQTLGSVQLEVKDFQKTISSKIAVRVTNRLARPATVRELTSGYFDPGSYVVIEVSPSTLIESIFETATNMMRAEKWQDLTALISVYNNLCFRECDQREADPYILRSRKMLKAMAAYRAMGYGYTFQDLKDEHYSKFLEELKTEAFDQLNHEDENGNKLNSLKLIDFYIFLTVKVLEVLKFEGCENVLAASRDLLSFIYRLKKMIKIEDVNSSPCITPSCAVKLISAFEVLTAPPSPIVDNVFAAFFNELTLMVYRKLKMEYQQVVTVENEAMRRLSGKPSEMVDVSVNTTEEVKDRATVRLCRFNYEAIEVMLSRFGLYHQFKSEGHSRLNAIPCPPVTDITEVISRYKKAVHELGELSYTYGQFRVMASETLEIPKTLIENSVYPNSILFLSTEVALLYIEAKNIISDDPALIDILANLEIIRLILRYYHREANSNIVLLLANIIKDLSIENIRFNDYFTKEFSQALIDMLQYRFIIILHSVTDQGERRQTVKGLVKQLSVLLDKLPECPPTQRAAANSFVVNYFMLCIKAAEFPVERMEFTPLLLRVTSLITDPNKKTFFRLLMKIFGAKHGYVSQADIFQETQDWCQSVKLDFSNRELTSHHQQSLYSYLNLLNVKNIINAEPDKKLNHSAMVAFILLTMKLIQEAKDKYIKSYIKEKSCIPGLQAVVTEEGVLEESDAKKNRKKAKRDALKRKKRGAKQREAELIVDKGEPIKEVEAELLVVRDIGAAHDLVEVIPLIEIASLNEEVYKPEVSELNVKRVKYKSIARWQSTLTFISRPKIAELCHTPALPAAKKASLIQLKKPQPALPIPRSKPASSSYLADATTASIFQRLGVVSSSCGDIECRDIAPLGFSDFHMRFIKTFRALNIPVYVYDDYVSDAIYKLSSHSLSLLCLADFSRIMAIFNDPYQKKIYGLERAVHDEVGGCIRLEFNTVLLSKLNIALKKTDLNIIITCDPGQDIKQVINKMSDAYPLNSRLFYDVKNSQLLARARYLQEFIVYPVYNPNPACQSMPRLDIAVDHGEVINPDELILDAIAMLARYSRFGMGFGHNLHQFTQSNKHHIVRNDVNKYSFERFTDLFLKGYARSALYNLSGVNVLHSLFPMMNERIWADMWKAACVVDDHLEKCSYENTDSLKLLSLQTEFLALSFYNTFIENKNYILYLSPDNSELYLGEVKLFMNTLPFAVNDNLCEEVAILFYDYLHKDKLPQLYDAFMGQDPKQHYRNCDARKFKNNVSLLMPAIEASVLEQVANKLWGYHMAVLMRKVEPRSHQLGK